MLCVEVRRMFHQEYRIVFGWDRLMDRHLWLSVHAAQ